MFHGNILAIGAHPDDIEYGVFGTLYKFSNCGIFCFVATMGGINDSTSGDIRRIESNSSMSYLKPKDIFWGNRIGIGYDEYSKITSDIESIVNSCNINLVITPSNMDTHQDHRMISDITLSACRRSNATILFYPTLSTIEFSPKIFVDISNVFHMKKEALSLLVSQKNKPYMRHDYLEIFNRDSFSSIHGLNYVERFDIGGAFL